MSSTADPLSAFLLQLVQRFQRLSEPKRRYELLIWYAKRLQEVPASNNVLNAAQLQKQLTNSLI